MSGPARGEEAKRLNLALHVYGGGGAPPGERGQPRLLLDLDRCTAGACGECRVECDFFYHPGNQGVLLLRELATYQVVCRRCEHPHCVEACPTGALEQGEDRVLVRHLNLCVACRSCSHACPYGTIFPDLLSYHAANCDLCAGRTNGREPLCVRSCPEGALMLPPEDWREDEKIVAVGDLLLVRSRHWRREKA
ncbi:MAG: hypothetical protein Kow00109_05070 [Acidobacteriota bacterium]